MSQWSPDFAVSLMRDYVVPAIGAGFMLAGIGWLVGFVVGSLFRLMR